MLYTIYMRVTMLPLPYCLIYPALKALNIPTVNRPSKGTRGFRIITYEEYMQITAYLDEKRARTSKGRPRVTQQVCKVCGCTNEDRPFPSPSSLCIDHYHEYRREQYKSNKGKVRVTKEEIIQGFVDYFNKN